MRGSDSNESQEQKGRNFRLDDDWGDQPGAFHCLHAIIN